MPRAPRAPNPLPAAAENEDNDTGQAEPSCSTPAHHQAFRPVTRSMTRKPTAIAASPDVKEGGPASTSRCKSTTGPCFSTQSAASRPSVTRVRSPHKVASSAWKPLTQPVAMDEDLKRTIAPSTNPSVKRSRVASSQAAKDSPTVHRGKKRNEESTSRGDQLDGAAIPSPSKKLQTGKNPSDVIPKRKLTIRNQDGKLAAPLSMVKLETESGESSVIVSSNIGHATRNDNCQSVEAVQLCAQQLQLDTKNNSNDIITEATANVTNQANLPVASGNTEAIVSGTSQVNQLTFPVTAEAIPNRAHHVKHLAAPFNIKPMVNRTSQVNKPVSPARTDATANRGHQVVAQNKVSAPVITVPRQNFQEDVQRKLAKLLIARRQISGSAPAGTSAPLVTPKLEIGKAKASPSNVLSDPAYANAKAFLIKQQEQLLQQYKSASSQQQQVHIKGPALADKDEAPPVEPLGTRCQLCKIDVAFRPQGDNARDNAPPVVAVLACHHAFHSHCFEAIYGLAEPSQCVACVDSGKA
ncbi:endochitinase A-like [Oryza brachyantha]|uniref:RING-type domain-containing protein n=1 Tax=Oryza brachyantha TaxID=4533 RepID=J3LHY5_ORYBR|nr:endochitinase A-like [Oryza brachyantha]